MINKIKIFFASRFGKALLVLAVFIFSFAVRALPLLQKKYPMDNDAVQMVLARNIYFGLGYKMETKDGIILAPSLVAERAMPASNPYVGVSLAYALLFKIFGFAKNLFLPMMTTLLAHAAVTALLFLLVKKMFNWGMALVFALFDIFLPIIIKGSLAPELYEFAAPAFTVGLLFYLYTKSAKPAPWRLIFAGVFFTLAIFARNAMMFSYGAFVVYEFYKNRSWKRALLFILPGILIAGGALLYAIPRNYATGFAGGMIGKTTFPSQFYSHIFPDAYTYNYDQTNYFASGGDKSSVYNEPFMAYGRKYSLKEYLAIYAKPATGTILGFFPLIVWGGPLILLLFVFGVIFLYREKRELFELLIIWFIVWFAGLFFARTVNWTHYLELEFIFVLTISVGFYWLMKLLLKSEMSKKIKYVLFVTAVIFTLVHLIDANKWMLHENYRGDMQGVMIDVAAHLNGRQLTDKDVIATGFGTRSQYILNYLTGLNYIYFNPETLQRLIKENRLTDAFKIYNVNKIIGYTSELSDAVAKAAKVESLATDNHVWEETHIIDYK